MNYRQGKEHFIQAWGDVAINWGINKTMGQVHALILISEDHLCADDIQEQLSISSGNANMNIKALMDWGLIYKNRMEGCRKDYYIAEKNMWEIFRKIILQRKRKELDPMIAMLDEVSKVEGLCTQSKEFCSVVTDLKAFSDRADGALSSLCKEKQNWLLGTFLKSLR